MLRITPSGILQRVRFAISLQARALSVTAAEPDDVRRKRMMYRAKQRGWLEVDLLLGKWAAEHVPSLAQEELDEFERVLACETIDVFHYITGQKPVPEELRSSVMQKLQEYAKGKPLGTTPEDYANVKRVYSN